MLDMWQKSSLKRKQLKIVLGAKFPSTKLEKKMDFAGSHLAENVKMILYLHQNKENVNFIFYSGELGTEIESNLHAGSSLHVYS